MADAPNQAGEPAARQPQAMANRMYPVPPYYYKAFTDQAWKAHKLARQAGPTDGDRGDISPARAPSATALVDESVWNPFISSDRDDLSRKTRILFKPPRADWMIENDYFESFGQPHQLHVKPASEHELFLPSIRPTDVDLTDRQYLHLLLRSLLHTKLKLVEALTKTLRPPETFQRETQELWKDTGNVWANEGEPYARHMHNLALRMILVTNGLRDAQARLTTELMLKAQIERRKGHTAELKSKCDELRRKLQDLRTVKSTLAANAALVDAPDVNMDSNN